MVVLLATIAFGLVAVLASVETDESRFQLSRRAWSLNDKENGMNYREAIEECDGDMTLKTSLEKLPCSIDRVRNMSLETFTTTYYEKRPVIVEFGLERNRRVREMMSPRAMIDRFGQEMVTLGTANSYTGRTQRRMSLREYLEYVAEPRTARQRGDETFYLFGDTPEPFWDILVDSYRIPHLAKSIDPDVQATIAIGLGGKNSGVPFHFHNSGWNEVLLGSKRFFLYPKDITPPFKPNRSQLQWVQETYPSLTGDMRPIECVIVPGEALYFPSRWYHATLNLSPHTAFVATFT